MWPEVWCLKFEISPRTQMPASASFDSSSRLICWVSSETVTVRAGKPRDAAALSRWVHLCLREENLSPVSAWLQVVLRVRRQGLGLLQAFLLLSLSKIGILSHSPWVAALPWLTASQHTTRANPREVPFPGRRCCRLGVGNHAFRGLERCIFCHFGEPVSVSLDLVNHNWRLLSPGDHSRGRFSRAVPPHTSSIRP